MTADVGVTVNIDELLARFPLAAIHGDDGKDERGTAVVIGGSVSVPGAVLLAGVAALRAGAGKLQIATASTVSPHVAIAVPEAKVIGLRAMKSGELSPRGMTNTFRDIVERADAVLIGPGTDLSPKSAVAFVESIIAMCSEKARIVLDAACIHGLTSRVFVDAARREHVIITPHAGEMAALMELSRESVEAQPESVAQRCADRFEVTVVLKGGHTFVAHRHCPLMRYSDGDAGLGTSGSGDVLAGIIAGLCARNSPPLTAAAWGVWCHGSAGNRLAKRIGRVGYLANELLAEVPALLGGYPLVK